MVKAKKFILKKHFDGFPTSENFELIEEELPELEVGGILLMIRHYLYLLDKCTPCSIEDFF